MSKSIILLASLIVLYSSSLFADDRVVPPSMLPAKAQSFIQNVFSGAQILKVEKDGMEFDVKLSNGVSIDFLVSGDWTNIDSDYIPIPDAAFPPAIVQSVKKSYPQATIIDAEKERGNYKLKLNNMMEILISANGQIIGQKFDD